MREFRLIVIIVLQVIACFSLAWGDSSSKLYNLPPELTQPQGGSAVSSIDYPDVPRISAQEAAQNIKAGKAILIQAGGEVYERRHILGSIELISESVEKGITPLPNFPTGGIEIYTYCF